jgi:hypothetical protein
MLDVRVVVEIRISDLWAAFPYRLVDGYQHLGGETFLRPQSERQKYVPFYTTQQTRKQ